MRYLIKLFRLNLLLNIRTEAITFHPPTDKTYKTHTPTAIDPTPTRGPRPSPSPKPSTPPFYILNSIFSTVSFPNPPYVSSFPLFNAAYLNPKFKHSATASPNATTSGPVRASKSFPLRSRINLPRHQKIKYPQPSVNTAMLVYTTASARAM